jgi:hyaluronoglucosaminidase
MKVGSNITKPLGVIEGFYGPPWSSEARRHWAQKLSIQKNSFYIYAPKRDQALRKNWNSPWTEDSITALAHLKNEFQALNVKFGVGLSPFELQARDPNLLQLKSVVHQLRSLGVDLLGLFFDDMHAHEGLAEIQVKAVNEVAKIFPGKIYFCPTYYSADPILEKLFGKMPVNYFEVLKNGISSRVEFIWTGPKVISPSISVEEADKCADLYGRKPFLWENLYANDGPKNCRYLKLKNYDEREPELLKHLSGIAFNLMNQSALSELVYHSSVTQMFAKQNKKGKIENHYLLKTIESQTSTAFQAFYKKMSENFLSKSLDELSQEYSASELEAISKELDILPDRAAKDIAGWLRNEYIVGPECLTD